MADNVTANPGAGGSVFATDDIGGVHYPRTKLVIGTDGTVVGDVSSSNPMPVTGAVTISGPATVVGTGTFAVQAAISGPVTVVGTGTLAVQVSGPVTVVGTGTLAVQASSVAQHTVLGTGTFAVQESGAAATSLALLDDVIFVDDAPFTPATSKVAVIGGVYQASPNTLDDGDAGAPLIDSSRRVVVAPGSAEATIGSTPLVRVAVFDASNNQIVSFGGSATIATVVGTGTFAVQATSVAQHTVVGNGTFAVQASISGPVTVVGTGTLAVQPSQHTVVGNGTFAVQPSQHTVVGNGTFAVQATIAGPVTVVGTGTFAVQPSQHTVIGNGTLAVQPTPHTTVGLSIFRSLDLDEGAAEQVKGSAGALYGGFVTNTSTGTRFVKFYNATAATVGVATPVMTFAIPGNATDDIGATFNTGGVGIPFATGICVGASTGVADADTGAPGANDVVINLWYA